MGRGVSCEVVACQVKGDTQHIEKGVQKNLGNFEKALALSPSGHAQIKDILGPAS